jgi:tetratricopeptide (TPR) repeat protein
MAVTAEPVRRAALQDAQAFLAAGDVAAAATVATRAVEGGMRHPLLFNLAAWAREEAGDFAGAGDLLNHALALAPRDYSVVAAIGRVMIREDRAQEALPVLDAALAMAPEFAPAWHDRGIACELLGDRAGAEAAFRRAVRCDPTLSGSHARLATIAAGDERWDTARASASRALKLDPRQHAATQVLAAADAMQGERACAAARLDALLGAPDVDDDVRADALTLRADLHEQARDAAAAFAAFAKAQAIDRARHGPRFGPGGRVEAHVGFARRIGREALAQPTAAWQPPQPPLRPAPARSHVFLLGYPRTGATLVEALLLALGACATEERPTLAEADEAFLRRPGGIARLASLDRPVLEAARAAYWARVRGEGVVPDARVFVDMYPLNAVKLPVIAKLFPEARVLLTRRDPRDVVLSCFRRRFTISAAAYAFTDLAEAAHHYAAVAELVEAYLAALPLNVRIVRYDELVSDFDVQTRAISDFVGLDWTERVHDFAAVAHSRQVRTSSAPQIRRGLYDGAGQWRRYHEQLAPILPILEPWVRRYGFEPSQATAAAA